MVEDRRRSPTILDVAAAAGVSAMTVSRVLNGLGGAAAVTQQRVFAAADRLGYRPNSFAKGLKNDRSQTVGLVVPDIVNPFFAEIIRGAELVARPAGYMLLSCNVVEDPAREEEAIQMLLAKRVDGVIICSARLTQQRLLRSIKPHRAAVLINRVAPVRAAGTIEIDYRRGMETATEMLIESGRTRIAFASGPTASYGGRRRKEGIDAALARHGSQVVIDIPSSPDLQGGADVARRLKHHETAIDAVVCYNDLIAVALMAGLQESGIRVPEQIALIGCDDILPAALVHPGLTTLSVRKRNLGETAMHMLIDRINGEDKHQQIVIQPDLIVRGSALPG